MKPVYERLSAKKYYGKHSTGSVILRNGIVIMHDKPSVITKVYNSLCKK